MTHLTSANGLAYRPEVDGLRALAVLPVILFHAGFPVFSGGFVGVDVFFVISGYLITGIILAEIANQRFSVVSFYERRARRLLPALFVVMAAILPFAWAWLLPRDLVDFGESLIAVATFCSNILFWRESDYFAGDASLKPLLHTWSLAVEEQYYLFFPLLLILLTKLRTHFLAWILLAAALLSLVFATWGAANKPTAAFYLLPTRGWELLIGALLAVWFASGTRQISALLGNCLGALGFLAILYAVFAFDESTPVPGLAMLVPTLGTAAIIVGTLAPSPVRYVLSWRPVVLLGLISYSAYLWHQPMFALSRYLHPLEQPLWLAPALVLATLLLAFLTWKFVETPWRDRTKTPRKTVFMTAGAGMALFIAAGLGLKLAEGVPERLSTQVLAITADVTKHELLRDDGGCSRNRDQTTLAECIKGANVAPRIGIVGDSHATSLVPALEAHLRARGASFVQYTKLGCPFSVNVDTNEGFRCPEFWENVFADIDRRGLDTVLVVSRWSYYLNDRSFDNGQGGVEPQDSKKCSVVGLPYDAPIEQRAVEILDAYRQAIRRLDQPGRKVLVVLPMPEQGWDVPRLMARMATLNPEFEATQESIPPLPRSLWLARHASVLKGFGEFKAHPRIQLFDPTPALCPLDHGNACPAFFDGAALFYDDDHPTVSGANRVLDALFATDFAVDIRGKAIATVSPSA